MVKSFHFMFSWLELVRWCGEYIQRPVRFASEHGQPEVLYTILGLALNPARR